MEFSELKSFSTETKRDNVDIMDEKQYNTTSTAMLSQRQAAESSAERMKIVN